MGNKSPRSTTDSKRHNRIGVTSDNAPMPGASIRVVNTEKAAVTDINGNFTIKSVKVGDVLHMTFIGMEDKLVEITSDIYRYITWKKKSLYWMK